MKTTYQCEICGKKHGTAEAAIACEALPMTDMKGGNFTNGENAHEAEVGEIVECAYPAMSWWKGDEDWRVHRERGGRFLDGFYHLWVVVAKVPAGDWHGWKYVLWTPSDHNGNECLCWTGPQHYRMWANRMATETEMAAAQAAFDAVENKQRIPLM